MATVQEPRAKHQHPAERDPQVYHPLDRLRGVIRRYVVIEGLLLVALFVALWFAVGLALDYGLFKVSGWDWVQDGSWSLRLLALLTSVALFMAILVFRIATRLSKEFSYPALALVLERRFPKVLGDRLITAVEMADVEAMTNFGYSKDMLRATIAEARERVGKVPVQEVFNWRRLWVLGFLTVAVLLGTVAFSYASYAVAAKSASPVRFGWKFAHVTGIFLERNVALMDTPWPRRAHLELVGFPAAGELTVGRDAEPPTITARAYSWVIADPGAPAGWRPLLWSDLTDELVGRSVPALPASITAEYEEGGTSVDTVQWFAYEVEGEDPASEDGQRHARLKTEMNGTDGQTAATQDYEQLQEVFKALAAKADKPSMGRTLRRLEIPDGAKYKFAGLKTAGNGDLARKPRNTFSGLIADRDGKMVKEDVMFVVKAADFATAARKIRPIPPPSLKRLYRDQAEPAYLHHAPPAGEGYVFLEDRLQTVATKDLSLTGDRTVFVVPAGTDLTLRAEAYTNDEGVLSEVDAVATAHARPKTGRFPGTVLDKDGKPTETPIPLELAADGSGWSVRFHNSLGIPVGATRGGDFLAKVVGMVRDATNFQVNENVEFRVEFSNKYGVKTTRAFLIQAQKDQPPVVEFASDVIRKVNGPQGPVYLVTPNAKIPFNPESFIRDDRGLSKVEYTFEYWAEDSDVVRGIRTKLALRSLLDVPLPGTMPSAFLPRVHADNLRSQDKGDDHLYGSAFLSEYENQKNALARDTRDQFKASLQIARGEDAAARTVQKVELKNSERDYFDLKELNDRGLIDLRPKAGEVQKIYRMDLNIQATDTNVDNPAGPQVARNIEPIRLRIVSDGDLLLEISKEQAQLGDRLDEALAKLEGAKQKYEFVRNSNGYKEETPEQVDAVKVRAQDALGDVDKARDIVQSVGRELARLARECEVNRLPDATVAGYKKYVDIAEQLQSENSPAASFPKTLAFLNFVQTTLNNGRWAPLASVTDTQNSMFALEREVREFRQLIGKRESIDELRKSLIALKEKQARIEQEVRLMEDDWRKRISTKHPTYGEVGAVFLENGEKKGVQQSIRWNQYPLDDIVVKFRVLDADGKPVTDGVIVPPEMKLNFEQHQFRFEYTITGGTKPGSYKVRLEPAVGPFVEFSVTVK